MTTTAEFIAGFEGYAGRAYWDVNAFRIGYGSDTEGPEQIHVTEGMETTKARALQNLALRIPQFQQEAIYGHTGMGRDVWEKLTANQRTAITSLVYNYGRLPVLVTPNDQERTAAAIRALQNANGGVNRKRRLAEAAFYLTADVQAPQPGAPAPAPQVPTPPARPTVPPMPAPPAGESTGLPPISAQAAGRITAVLDNLGAMRDAYLADIAAAQKEVAIIETTIADFGKLQGAKIVPPPILQIPAAKPAAVEPKGTSIMETVSPQITAMIRNVLIFGGGFVVSKGYVDNTTMISVVGGLMSLGGAAWSAWGHRTSGVIAAAAALPDVQKIVTTSAIADSPKFSANNRVVAH